MIKQTLGVLLLGLGLLLAGCAPQAQKKGITEKYYYTTTEDGITLAFKRYQPATLSSEKNPVILCHGLSYNLLFWDLDKSVSLPRYLAERGYDVWSLSLRGSAPSTQPLNSGLRKLGHFNLDPSSFQMLTGQVQALKMMDWSVDDHIRLDVPAAINFVNSQTECPRVHWIGHSMGGMVMFAYLQEAKAANNVKSFVALATPMTVFHPLNDPFRFLVDTETALGIGTRVLGTSTPATVGVILGDIGSPTDKLFFNSRNIDPQVLRELFRLVQEDMSPGQFKQLIGMVRTERFTSLDGSVDYTAGLAQVKIPVYFIAGTVDNMATIGAVQYAYRAVGSREKKFKLFGVVNGQQNDYGHDDLVIGRQSQKEVYPTILEWLDTYPCATDEGGLLLQPQPAPGTPESKTPNGQ